MTDWSTFEQKLFVFPYYSIHNQKQKDIVLFGNCHMATLGYFLNELLCKQYNIHIIISYFFEKSGFHNFDMDNINKLIQDRVSNCTYFIYQMHFKDYGINANTLQQYVSKETKVFRIPNIRLIYNTSSKEEFHKSLEMLSYNITHSDFQEFIFLTKYWNKIQFFNTNEHPTHYVLFLVAQSLVYRIINHPKKISINDYFNDVNRKDYKKINEYILLPGIDRITSQIYDITGININADYFD